MKKYAYLILFTLLVLMIACQKSSSDHQMVDPNANELTRNLYTNLHDMAGKGMMFGHQNTLAYGYSWSNEELTPGTSRSDVYDVTGSYPAVYGWDIADFINPGFSDSVRIARMKRLLKWSQEGFDRGGVLTYSWHAANPVNTESFYDTTRAVYTLLPGGSNHDAFKTTLDHIADFFNQLAPTPAIFRPWHEHNGDWFWWGKGLCTEAEYIQLWRFTVEYLRDEKGVHNLLYAFSPDRSRIDINQFKEDYLYAYPGDEYIDIIGLDNYWDLGHPVNLTPPDQRLEQFRRSIEYTVEISDEKGKVAALTEGGLEAIPDSTFWTRQILESVLSSDKAKRITYFAVWRNANYDREQRDHYYAPFPGQISAPDFVDFREHPFILFEDELPDLYAPLSESTATKTYSPTDSRIGVIGRVITDESGAVSFAASGVTFQFQFEGTFLDIVLDDEHRNGTDYNLFAATVNGGEPTYFKTIKGRSTYRLSGKLPYGTHNATLTKITEGQNGRNRLISVVTQYLLQSIDLRERRIEFIGDSITCGFGADSTRTRCYDGTWYDQHNALQSYANLIGESFEAQVMLSAVSGIGMHRNWNTPGPTMPDVYNGVFMEGSDSLSQWDFKNYTPDLVVIALGTNDFSDGDGDVPRPPPDSLVFVTTYTSFLGNIRDQYSDAQILLLASPMLDTNRNDKLHSLLTTIVADFENRGDDHIHVYRFSNQYINGCGSHPGSGDHIAMATELQPVIQSIMNWYPN